MNKSFDHLASSYALLEQVAFWGALQRAREVWLAQLESAERVLLLGEGNGRFASALLSVCSPRYVECIDASGKMMAQAQRRLRLRHGARAQIVHFRHGDACSLALEPGAFDAVVTCFFLDCLEGSELAGTIQRIASALRPGGRWLQADFAPGQSPWARGIVAALYLFFGALTDIRALGLEDPRPHLLHAGLALGGAAQLAGGLLYSEWYTMAAQTA